MVAISSEAVSQVLALDSAALPADLAQTVLTWRFSDRDRQRVADLLERNNANALSAAERQELRTFMVLGDLLNVLHAQAHLTLKQAEKVS